MLAWFTSWIYWRSNPVKAPVMGPARNAPAGDDGKAIKAILAESVRSSSETKEPVKKASSSAATPQVVLVSAADINKIRGGFRKVQPNGPSSGSQDPPLLKEMNAALADGHEKYFEQIRSRRRAKIEQERRNKLDEEMQALLLELVPKQTNVVAVVSGPLVYLEDIMVPKLEITVIEHILAQTSIESPKPTSEPDNEITKETRAFETI